MITEFLKPFIRRGRLFGRYYRECEDAEGYSPGELVQYQNERLARIIAIAFNSVPFYRKLFRERNLTPNDIRTVDDLQKLPMIDKKVVRDNFKELRNVSFWGPRIAAKTGGSRGVPGVFLRDLHSASFECAALWRHYAWAGKEPGTNRVTLRGAVVVPLRRTTPPFWKYVRWDKNLFLSSFHMSDMTLPSYVEEIRRYQPFDLYAYPSTAYVLANFCKRMSLDLRFSCVFTSSEMLLTYQRDEIQKVFGCSIFDWYGSGERVAAIGQCEYGQYHEIPHYGIVEYLPLGDNRYEIVATAMHNFVMPLIRYKLGDIVEFGGTSMCACGRAFRVVKNIIGRDEDLIILEDGRRVIVMEERIFRGLRNMKEAQITQNARDSIVIRIVPENPHDRVDADTIIERMTRFVGGKKEIYAVEVVPRIERANSGKFTFVRNNCSNIEPS